MYKLLNKQLTKSKGVKDAVRNELFPTADMVVSMSKEFGVPFTTEDFEGNSENMENSIYEMLSPPTVLIPIQVLL